MDVVVYTHEAFKLHDTGADHPERPARLDALLAGLEASPATLDIRSPAPASHADLELVHDAHYIDVIERFCAHGGGAVDVDTVAVPESWEAALRAAGAGLEAIDVLSGSGVSLAVCAVRPPGHHALSDRAMGFCLFNNAAVTAAALVASGSRVAIVDWDVHHGNGTQEIFLHSPDVLYTSIHEWGPNPDAPSVSFFPGSGWLDEVGVGPGHGTTVNVPLPAGSAGDVAREAFATVVVPALTAFDPDWLLVSCGFDAHHDDPLAHLHLREDDYTAMAAHLADLGLPTVVFSEGGYDLAAVEASMAATIAGFAGGDPRPPVGRSPDLAWRLVEQASAAAAAAGAMG